MFQIQQLYHHQIKVSLWNQTDQHVLATVHLHLTEQYIQSRKFYCSYLVLYNYNKIITKFQLLHKRSYLNNK